MRAAIIVTTGKVVDDVTLRTQHSTVEDPDGVVEHLWLETSEQLLADLRLVCDLAKVTAYDGAFFGEGPEDYEAVMRVRALLPKEEDDE